MVKWGQNTSFYNQIKTEILEAYRFRYVTYAYVTTNLKLRYRRSSLGFIWTVLAPMLHYILIGLVFTLLMSQRRSNYFAYYFSGALFFAIISGILNKAPTIFIANENFIKKIYVPKLTFVLNVISIEVVNFFLSGSTLILLGLMLHKFEPTWMIFASIIPVIYAAISLLGITCLISVITVYFRDFIHIMPVGLQALFFATPIVFDETMIPEKYHWIIVCNPVYYLLKMFRGPLLDQTLAPASLYLYGLVGSVSILIFGLFIIKKFDNRIVFKL
jgi:homopolymeric O-antigen transport system permease protein